jgi:Na+-transporting methylmalonyl-CoA/oxaloacetate decarboxylase gamma subunit
MAVLLTLLLLAAVIAVVSAPLLRTRPTPEPETAPRHSALSAAREAKYREIRDAELDYKTGKLSQTDYDAINASLRAEAVAILDQLEALDAPTTTVS